MAKIFGSFKSGVRAAFDPLGRALIRAGVSPDAVTSLGTAGVVAGVGRLRRPRPPGRGHRRDHAVRAARRARRRDGPGAGQLHPVRRAARLDAWTGSPTAPSSAALAWWLATDGQHVLAAVCLVCLVGGQVVSYVKARAEGLGFTCDVGIAERMERLILVGIGALLTGFGGGAGAWPRCMWLLAALTSITAVLQRLVHVRRQEQRGQPAGRGAGRMSRLVGAPRGQR